VYPRLTGPNAFTVDRSTYSLGQDFTTAKTYGAAGLAPKQFFRAGNVYFRQVIRGSLEYSSG
jgi:hypothetical protein